MNQPLSIRRFPAIRPVRSLPPVDELALLRARIAELREREERLCADLLDPVAALPWQGEAFCARMVRRTRRTLDPERLPRDVLEDERNWITISGTEIILVPRDAGQESHPALPGLQEDDLLIEPF